MARFLVHIHTGPENPTKATLGFLVALTALNEGHHVDVFLAGDGVSLLGEEALETVEGTGTGSLRSHFGSIVAAGGRFFVSGMSAMARGFDDGLLEGKPAQFAMPDVLIRLAADADATLVY